MQNFKKLTEQEKRERGDNTVSLYETFAVLRERLATASNSTFFGPFFLARKKAQKRRRKSENCAALRSKALWGVRWVIAIPYGVRRWNGQSGTPVPTVDLYVRLQPWCMAGDISHLPVGDHPTCKASRGRPYNGK